MVVFRIAIVRISGAMGYWWEKSVFFETQRYAKVSAKVRKEVNFDRNSILEACRSIEVILFVCG